ncbi:hypothetical protein [Methyloligella solikamskensis]|uniref:Uncharacterized protein n=1 Tax=Methyloligella solikamskensis TaxID=1177756 RepID=A0ABW3JC69_9HYPH
MLKVLGFVAALLVAVPAFALPAPLSEKELTEQSDLVALIEVLSVTSVGALPDMETRQALLFYHAKAKVLEVKKGDVKPGTIITIEFREVPEDIVGRWEVSYYAGEELWTYLKKRGGNYRATAWNARGEQVRPAVSNKLPAQPGQTISAE